MPSEENEWNKRLLKNAIEMVQHHKKTCIGSECTISCYMILVLLEKANIEVSPKIKKEFL